MPNFFIISGPSGVGKDTIVNGLLKRHPNWSRLTTSTTRSQMEGEPNRKYRHLSKREFHRLIDQGEIFESAKVHGQLYGVTKKEIARALKSGKIFVFDLDVQGARGYRKKLGDRCFLIFLKPESLRVLEKRIRKRRRGEGEKEIVRRLEDAKEEMKMAKEFDSIILNPEGRPEEAIEAIEIEILK